MADHLIRVPLHQVRFKPNIPAGMDGYVLLGLVPKMRETDEDHIPISVGHFCHSCKSWRIEDGRHRAIAALIGGRADVLAIEETDSANLS